jgi:hypothetical protein
MRYSSRVRPAPGRGQRVSILSHRGARAGSASTAASARRPDDDGEDEKFNFTPNIEEILQDA